MDKDESLISHIEALRECLLRCLTAVALVLPFALYVAPKALDFLVSILIGNNNVSLNYFSPMEVFLLQIKLALLLDVAVCFPYIMRKLWDFILPALYKHERKTIGVGIVLSSILFFAGIAFCLFLILPLIISFGISFSGDKLQAMLGISNIINLAITLSLVFGLMFQVPLITHLLIRWEVVSYKTISSVRPYVVVGLLTVCAILTPPDIVSQVMLFIPTYLLFELGLLFSKKG